MSVAIAGLREGMIPLPPGVSTRKALFEHIGFDELAAQHPDHELFVVVWKTLPGNPFAVVFRALKSVIAERGWPLEICPKKRWAVVVPDAIAEMPPRETRA